MSEVRMLHFLKDWWNKFSCFFFFFWQEQELEVEAGKESEYTANGKPEMRDGNVVMDTDEKRDGGNWESGF